MVTDIGSGAFKSNSLESVLIPEGITEINSSTFSSNSLTSVIIPESVVAIGSNAFSSNSLTSVIIPDMVTGIGSAAFASNSLTSVVIPESVTTIGRYAFSSNSLTSVIIPDMVTDIGSGAFESNSLESVLIPEGITEINSSTFSSNSLTSVIIPESVVTIGSNAFSSNLLTSVIIPDLVTDIGSGAFSSNSLESVLIPKNVKYIGSGAFSENKLNSVEIPESVVYIGDEAFIDNVISLIELPLSDYNWIDSSGEVVNKIEDFNSEYKVDRPYILTKQDVIFEDSTITEYTNVYERDIIIPNNFDGVSVIGIADYAFKSKSLTSIVIPKSVKDIGTGAFQGNSLTSVIIPNGVTDIGFVAFETNSLTSVIISESVTKIGRSAFYNNSISSLTLPNSLTEIGSDAFANNSLTSLTIPESITEIEWGVFKNNDLTSLVIPESVTKIGPYAFDNNSISSLTLPNSLIEIASYAFRNNSLSSLTLPHSLSYIGFSAFSINTLSSIDIPESVTYIGKFAFYDNLINSLELPLGEYNWVNSNGEIVIEATDLYNCRYRLDKPYLLTKEDVVFEGGAILDYTNSYEKNIIIPDNYDGESVTAIGPSAFSEYIIWEPFENSPNKSANNSDSYDTGDLKSVFIPASVKEIGKFAFFDEALEKVEIAVESELYYIGVLAFGSAILEPVVLPESKREFCTFSHWTDELNNSYEDLIFTDFSRELRAIFTPDENTLMFTLKDEEGLPISNLPTVLNYNHSEAKFTFDTILTTISDASGVIIINDLKDLSSYPVNIEAQGFEDVQVTLSTGVNTDVELVALIESVYMFTIMVTNLDDVPLEGLTVSINGKSYTSNSEGIINVLNLTNGTYNYTGMLADETINGSVIIEDEDEVLSIVLPIDSSVLDTLEEELKVYPNPIRNGILNIEFSKPIAEGTLQIYNTSGNLVLQKELSVSQKRSSFNLSNLPKGVYLIRVNSNIEGLQTTKITIL